MQSNLARGISRAALAAMCLTLAARTGRAQSVVPPRAEYTRAVSALAALVEREMRVHDIPGLTIALVDDSGIVWARGFGVADMRSRAPATVQTVYRVGSIARTFTDLAIMRLVEADKLDLDRPVTRWLPEFRPHNSFGDPITLRQLMALRSGLPRNPPVGHEHDATSPTLAKTVASLDQADIIFEPGTRAKYSDAALAVAGLAAERAAGEPFATLMSRLVLTPLGMMSSGFAPAAEMRSHIATGYLWDYDAPMHAAPTFSLGDTPAAGMYASAADLARFWSMMFAAGGVDGASFLKPQSVFEMTRPQFTSPGAAAGWGLGFSISAVDGRKRLSDEGSIDGFAAELGAYLEEKLGVVVLVNKDHASGVGSRLADAALAMMLATKYKRPLPAIAMPHAIPPALARALAGRYAKGARAVDLIRERGGLTLIDESGGVRSPLMQLRGDTLVTDDLLSAPRRLIVAHGTLGTSLVLGADTLTLAPFADARPLPTYQPLIGDYGSASYAVHVIQRAGRLIAVTDRFVEQPLTEISENAFRFPDGHGYDGEQITFVRNADKSVTGIVAGGVAMPRMRPKKG